MAQNRLTAPTPPIRAILKLRPQLMSEVAEETFICISQYRHSYTPHISAACHNERRFRTWATCWLLWLFDVPFHSGLQPEGGAPQAPVVPTSWGRSHVATLAHAHPRARPLGRASSSCRKALQTSWHTHAHQGVEGSCLGATLLRKMCYPHSSAINSMARVPESLTLLYSELQIFLRNL